MSALRDPLLARRAPRHAFGTRSLGAPPGLLRPQQVHGASVVRAQACGEPAPEADAIVSAQPGVPVGVVTADCVPVLLAAPGGAAVAALHAGWRGLAGGVVAAGVSALVREAGVPAGELVAAIGPHIGACCYEVDEPVLSALEAAHGAVLRAAVRPARPGHAQLDLGAVAAGALLRAGLPEAAIGRAAAQCTACDARRFHSYRRDGARSGRLVHFIAAGVEG